MASPTRKVEFNLFTLDEERSEGEGGPDAESGEEEEEDDGGSESAQEEESALLEERLSPAASHPTKPSSSAAVTPTHQKKSESLLPTTSTSTVVYPETCQQQRSLAGESQNPYSQPESGYSHQGLPPPAVIVDPENQETTVAAASPDGDLESVAVTNFGTTGVESLLPPESGSAGSSRHHQGRTGSFSLRDRISSFSSSPFFHRQKQHSNNNKGSPSRNHAMKATEKSQSSSDDNRKGGQPDGTVSGSNLSIPTIVVTNNNNNCHSSPELSSSDPPQNNTVVHPSHQDSSESTDEGDGDTDDTEILDDNGLWMDVKSKSNKSGNHHNKRKSVENHMKSKGYYFADDDDDDVDDGAAVGAGKEIVRGFDIAKLPNNSSFLVQEKWLKQIGQELRTESIHAKINHGKPCTSKMFVELYDLDFDPITGQAFWQETARWIKYEEDAEGIDHHWGRPHVAFLSFHALHQLKSCLEHGLIELDVEAEGFDDICSAIAGRMAEVFDMDEQRTNAVLATLQRKHRHVHEPNRLGRIPTVGKGLGRDSVADLKRLNSVSVANPAARINSQARLDEWYAARSKSVANPYPSSSLHTQVSMDSTGGGGRVGGGGSGPSVGVVGGGSGPHLLPTTSSRPPSFGRSSSHDYTTTVTTPPLIAAGRSVKGKTLSPQTSMDEPNLTTLKEEDDDYIGWMEGGDKTRSTPKIKWNLSSGSFQAKEPQEDTTSLPDVVTDKGGGGDGAGVGGGGRDRGMSQLSAKSNMAQRTSFTVRFGLGQAFSGIKSMHKLDQFGHRDHDIEELMKKVPEGAEAAQVFVGVLKELKEARFCMVRLKTGIIMPQLLDAPIPIRFLFVILGPSIFDVNYHEIGRSIATLMSNPHFHDMAYSAQSKDEISEAIDHFLDGSIVIPPGEIDSKQLLSVEEIKKALKRRNSRREANQKKLENRKLRRRSKRGPHGITVETKENGIHKEGNGGNKKKSDGKSSGGKPKKRGDPLKRTGRLFGGVVDDIRYRLPYYWSDIRDALNVQCLASVVFMFFAAFAPAITFGGLMGTYTGDTMGIIETLLAQCLCGVIWGVFSAQPLMVMSVTGPVMLFEASLFQFCGTLGLDFMTIRVWTGLWVLLIAIITVMFEGSFLVRYVTAFTEDIFAALISIIFIAESVKFVEKTFKKNPVTTLLHYQEYLTSCMQEKTGMANETMERLMNGMVNKNDSVNSISNSLPSTATTTTTTAGSILNNNWTVADSVLESMAKTALMIPTAASSLNDNLESNGTDILHDTKPLAPCYKHHQPDTGLLTAILMISTFGLALILKKLRTSQFFGRTIRRGLGDFGVLIAIVVVGLIDVLVFPETVLERVHIPASFGFTNATARGNGVMIKIWLADDQWYGYLFAAIPALLVYILLFVETEIAELILLKKDRGLKKGSGYHWDLFLCGALCFVCGLFGLPWMCAAAVQSFAHANSLTVMKRHAPGERPSVDHVIEQRVTTIGCALLVGACAFAGSFLQKLPMATLFGVFLYLGVMNMLPIQMMHRIVLFIIPEKYFPDLPFAQNVSMWRMHLWTGVQIICLIFVYLIKHFKASSLAFPFALMMVALVRLFIIPRLFKQNEIQALDGHDDVENEEEEESFPYSVF